MFKKATIALIAVMSCFALIGVGFSSWAMGAGNTVERSSTGKLSSESVIVSDEYIEVNIDNTKFIVMPDGFKSDMNVCNVSFTLKNISSLQNIAKKPKLRVTLTFTNSINEILTDTKQREALFNSIKFSVQGTGVDLSEVTSTSTSSSADYEFTINNISSLVGSGNTIQGTFTFNHEGADYTNLYKALQVEQVDGANEIKNPFSLVVAVSNDQ